MTWIIINNILLNVSNTTNRNLHQRRENVRGSEACVMLYANFIYAMELYIYTDPVAVDVLVQTDRRYQQLMIYRQQHRHNLRFYHYLPVTVNPTDSHHPSTLRCLHHRQFSRHLREINFIDHHRLTRRQSVCHHHTLSLRLLLLPKISAIPNCVYRS